MKRFEVAFIILTQVTLLARLAYQQEFSLFWVVILSQAVFGALLMAINPALLRKAVRPFLPRWASLVLAVAFFGGALFFFRPKMESSSWMETAILLRGPYIGLMGFVVLWMLLVFALFSAAMKDGNGHS